MNGKALKPIWSSWLILILLTPILCASLLTISASILLVWISGAMMRSITGSEASGSQDDATPR